MSDDPDVKGILIRGADGALYFIPDDHLGTFRIADDNSAKARKLLDADREMAKYGRAPAFYGKGLVEKLDPYGGSVCTVAIETGKLRSILKKKEKKRS